MLELDLNLCDLLKQAILLFIQVLSVQQIKKLQAIVDRFNRACTVEMKDCETKRHEYLTQIGNVLHPSVPISATEVNLCTVVAVVL